MLNIGVLASGGGTNLQSIISACETGLIHAEVVVVVSDQPDAYALQRAQQHGISAVHVPAADQETHEADIQQAFADHEVTLAVGAGYMRILSAAFIKDWYGQLINVHPALLPSFKGVNGQGDALSYGTKISGCTTHFMDDQPDHGPIILQAAVRVHDYDDRDTLAHRILQVEHQLLPRSIDLFERHRLKIEGRRVRILPGDSWLDQALPDVLYAEGF
jgi:phosphoribosylglycinamide formyltransferase-1